MKIEIKNRFTGTVILCGEYESIKDCLERNREADLRGAYLRGAKGYSESHVFFQEVVRQQKSDIFTIGEWGIIGQICIHELCWGSIKKRFNKKALKIFKKLSKVGFTEWEDKYKTEEKQ